MGRLHGQLLGFSRWVGEPFSDDLPCALLHETAFTNVYLYRKYWALGGRASFEEPDEPPVGTGDVKTAAALLVASLPPDVEVTYRRPAPPPPG